MMSQHDGHPISPFKFPEKTKETRYFARIILIKPVKANQWIEEKKARLNFFNGAGKFRLIPFGVKAQTGGGDKGEVKTIDFNAATAADRVDSCPNLRSGILGEIDEGRSWIENVNTAKAGSRRRYGDSQV